MSLALSNCAFVKDKQRKRFFRGMFLDGLEECPVVVAESLQGFMWIPIEVRHDFIVGHVDAALLGFIMGKCHNLAVF